MAQPSPAVAVCLMPQGSGREKNAVPSLERLLQQTAEAEGAPVSESCGMEPLLLQGLCAIRHWTGCRMEKGRERCFVPMIGVFWLRKPWALGATQIQTVCRFQGMSVHLCGLC